MDITRNAAGQRLVGEPPVAKPPVGPLFGADEAENLSLLFDPPGAPACATEERPQPRRLARLLPALTATWF